jgi:replicative DNA helicase
MSSPVDIAAALDAVMAEVVSASERIAGGKPADVTNLPDKMAPICAAIAELPRAEALAYAPSVQTLIAALDTMTGMLRERRDAMRQRLGQLESMQS